MKVVPPGLDRHLLLLRLQFGNLSSHVVRPALHLEERQRSQPGTIAKHGIRLRGCLITKTPMVRGPGKLPQPSLKPPKSHHHQVLLGTGSLAPRMKSSTRSPKRGQGRKASSATSESKVQAKSTSSASKARAKLASSQLAAHCSSITVLFCSSHKEGCSSHTRDGQVHLVANLGMVREDPPLTMARGHQEAAAQSKVDAATRLTSMPAVARPSQSPCPRALQNHEQG